MSTTEMKTQIPLLLEQVEDNFVEAVHALINAHLVSKQEVVVPEIGYDIEGKPQFESVEEMLDEFDHRVDNMKNGKYITIDQLEERSKTWTKTPTK